MDRTDAFAADDKLGRLAEINKTQLNQALRDINNFAKTSAGFNQQLYKNVSSNNDKNKQPPLTPLKPRVQKNALSTLEL